MQRMKVGTVIIDKYHKHGCYKEKVHKPPKKACDLHLQINNTRCFPKQVFKFLDAS